MGKPSSCTARAAASHHSVGDSFHAVGCFPVGVGSEGGAEVPSGAFQCCGALSVYPSGHQKICKGVTSIHILAKYHGKRFNIKPGVPLNPAGNLARDSRT